MYQAGTSLNGGSLVTSGGRVLAVCATATSLAEALKRAYQGVDLVKFDGAFYRKDIGAAASSS